MWVFRIWSEEAVEEISEWARGEDEAFEAREARILAGEDREHVEFFRERGLTLAKARAIGCNACHKDPRDGERARDVDDN